MSKRKSPEASGFEPLAFLPLTPAVFYILLVLAEGDGHGYAIMQEANRRGSGALRLGPGTLYAAIARLLDDGLITELESRPTPELDDSRRRYYRLSDRGSLVLSAEASRLAELARQAKATRAVRELKHA